MYVHIIIIMQYNNYESNYVCTYVLHIIIHKSVSNACNILHMQTRVWEPTSRYFFTYIHHSCPVSLLFTGTGKTAPLISIMTVQYLHLRKSDVSKMASYCISVATTQLELMYIMQPEPFSVGLVCKTSSVYACMCICVCTCLT